MNREVRTALGGALGLVVLIVAFIALVRYLVPSILGAPFSFSLIAAVAVAVLGVALTATSLGGRWVPWHRSQAWGAVAGLLATSAAVAFLLATQTGLLTVASVVTSLYPAITIALAALVLRERIHGPQGLGLLLCAVAVGLVAAG